MNFKLKRDFIKSDEEKFNIGDGGILAQYTILKGKENEVFKINGINSEEVAKVADLDKYFLLLIYNKPALKVKKIDGEVIIESFYGYPYELKGDLNKYGYTIFKNGMKAAQVYKENMEDKVHFWVDVNDRENQAVYIALVEILDYIK
ncbi:LURP-one-related/scramblase family protein [Clostridium sp. DL1XJH146]